MSTPWPFCEPRLSRDALVLKLSESLHPTRENMNIKTIPWLLAGALSFASTTFAAPGLVVDGTQFKYNGNRIFFSGMNLAWINYNSDVGADVLNENSWRNAVESIRAAGGNSIRWWLFNNMSTSPLIGSDDLVSGLPANTINNMKKALDIAEEYGVMVSMCLFSHNLMEKGQWGLYDNDEINIDANKKLFTDAGTTAFINKALKPVLTAIGNHNALMTWELFNEPEGMASGATGSWTAETTPILDIQKFSNKVAAAIKAHDSELLVSNGIHNAGAFQYWTDEALIAAGGEPTGVLDFYQVHFYPEHQTEAQSPFHHPASYWKVDGKALGKPLIIGEFSAAGWDKTKFPAYKTSSMTTVEAYEYAYENGYAGAMAWDFAGFNDIVAKTAVLHDYQAAKPGMEALYNQYESVIKIKDYTPTTTSGNGVMQVSFDKVNSADGATLELENKVSPDLTGNAVITFKARTVQSSDALSLYLVTKSGEWTWVDNNSLNCEVPANGAWVTCSFDLKNDYSGVTLSNVQSFLIRTFTDGYTGTIQIDDFKAGSINIIDFDKQYDLFGVAAGMDGGDAITKIETVYLSGTTVLQSKAANRLHLAYLQGLLSLQLPQVSQVQITTPQGATVYSAQHASGDQQISLHALPAGVYHVRVRSGSLVSYHSFVAH